MDDILRESDIRPDDLMKGQAEAYAADIRRLLQHKSEFVAVPCPACASEDSHVVFQKYGLTYVCCSRCQTMYVNPRPTPPVLEMYYSASENYRYWNKYIFPASENARRERIFLPRAERVLDICRRYGVRHGTLLEVGAGFGTFCEEVQRLAGFDRVIAVEPTPDLAETCRRRGIEVIEAPVERVGLELRGVDVIAAFEVIEHLFSPREFLLKCADILSSHGLLVITCPNCRGFDITVLQALSDAVDSEHLNYFHPSSLSQLASTCGFETLEVMTPGRLDAELVRKKILAGKMDVSSQPFLKQILVDDWNRVGRSFQQFLADSMLSSHMWLVGRKQV